jgi:hypothetical protein
MLARVVLGLFAIELLAGCIKGETAEERESGRKGRMECSDPEVIPGPSSAPSAANPYPPC